MRKWYLQSFAFQSTNKLNRRKSFLLVISYMARNQNTAYLVLYTSSICPSWFMSHMMSFCKPTSKYSRGFSISAYLQIWRDRNDNLLLRTTMSIKLPFSSNNSDIKKEIVKNLSQSNYVILKWTIIGLQGGIKEKMKRVLQLKQQKTSLNDRNNKHH